MSPERFLEIRSSGLNDVPADVSNDSKKRCNQEEKHAFIPSRFPEDLVASSIILGNVICGSVLMDGAIVVLGISLEGIKSSHLHGSLDLFDVHGSHWIETS